MFDSTPSTDVDQALEEKYQAARKSILAKQTRKAARGHAVMAVANSYGRKLDDGGKLATLSRFSQHFLIVTAFALPILLLLRVVF